MSRKRGPRRGSPDTREAILDAARASFAGVGYNGSTIRRIAGMAGVDPSLVIHYFGSKQDLFAASVALPTSPTAMIDRVFIEGVADDSVAERLTRLFFEVWEHPDSRQALLGQLRAAFETGQPPPMAEFVVDAVISRIGEFIEGPDAELRMELAASNLIGIAILRYVVALEPLASASVDSLVAEVAPRIRGYLTPAKN
ncbi:MAG: TetR family transcriptional regulator [Acidimicrobiia bacterium]